ncbi:MAG: hypothetical protein ACI4QN_02075 [Candidatus Coproplasma sp.]
MANINDAAIEEQKLDTPIESEPIEEQQDNKPANHKPNFKGKAKEWFRKQIVSLKRKPQRIAFLFFVITTLIYLLGLNVTSPGPVVDFATQPYLGLSVFIITLFSILVLVLFMNSFPKRGVKFKKNGKKHNVNYIMLALTFVFVIVMFLFDLLYYKQLVGCIQAGGNESKFFATMEQALKYEKYWSADFAANPVLDPASYRSYLVSALNLTIVHMVFLGISALLLATLPLYKKLIMMIDTSKEIEGTEIKEVIETED